jgi:ferredoxin
MLDWFEQELYEHIFNKRCPAKVCRGLIRYEVDYAAPADETGLKKAYDYCPTGAVKLIDGQYVIEDALCIRCDVCRECAPGSIRIVDAYEGAAGPEPELISVQPAYE